MEWNCSIMSERNVFVITAFKRSCWKVIFYTYLSVDERVVPSHNVPQRHMPTRITHAADHALHPRRRWTNGRYGSCWNAFLFKYASKCIPSKTFFVKPSQLNEMSKNGKNLLNFLHVLSNKDGYSTKFLVSTICIHFCIDSVQMPLLHLLVLAMVCMRLS